MNKFVLTDEAIEAELLEQEKREGVPERQRYPRPCPDLPYYKAISIETIKKAEPLIRQDERERLFAEIDKQEIITFHSLDKRLTLWQALKVAVEKEG